MSLSNYAELLIIEYLFSAGVVYSRPSTPWYIALHTSDPGETGANEVVVGSVTGYGRQVTDFDLASVAGDGTTRNDTAVTFSASAGSAVCTHISIWDNGPTITGNCLMVGTLNESRTLDSTHNITLAIGDIIASLD